MSKYEDDASGVTRGEAGGGPPRVTPEGEIFLWANLQRIVDKGGRTVKERCGVTPLRGGGTRVKSVKVTVVSKREKKVVSFFQKKIGVTPGPD